MSKPERKPRIFIGMPCYTNVPPEILEDFSRFTFYCGRFLQQYDFSMGIKQKSEQFRARTAIVEAAQTVNADYLLMLDDDMVIDHFGTMGPDVEAYQFLDKLVQHGKDICGALYWQRGGDHKPVLMKRVSEQGYRFMRDDEVEYKLQKVDVAGGGCLLVRMTVFDKIAHPYFAPEHKWGTDIQLCKQAAEKGIEAWADTSIEIGHLRQEKQLVTSRSRKRMILEGAATGEQLKQFVNSDIYTRLRADAAEYTGIDEADIRFRMPGTFFDNWDAFMQGRERNSTDLAEWYRLFPKDRILRQIWFNAEVPEKKHMTDYIIQNFDNVPGKLRVLDFGCGIGIPAFTLAERGHDVTAMDIRGTGTFEFLKWRSNKNGVPIRFVDSDGGVPKLDGKYDAIIAMDSIEHIGDWKATLLELSSHLNIGGVLFSNNGILENDAKHPEHFEIDNKEFIQACISESLMPLNQISYIKREVPVYA